MEHRRVCFCMLSLLPLVQISKLSQANSLLFGKVCCRTPRGVRGLKSPCTYLSNAGASRTPRGVRGLKYQRIGCKHLNSPRRTPRGVRGLKLWRYPYHPECRSRTPRGVRGLKSHRERGNPRRKGRTPRGVRGLKSDRPELLPGGVPSHPSRGAWIEILCHPANTGSMNVAPLAGCVD